jgi:hypothetical protein
MIGLLTLLLVGCAPVLEDQFVEDADVAGLAVTVETLTFEGNGNTFLVAIDALVSERGQPDRHMLVEETMADGTVWQGEALHYDNTPEGDRQILMLQQAQAGGETGLQIEGPQDIAVGTMLAEEAIPVDQPLYSAHPAIQFVRARQGTDGAWTFDVTITYPDTGWEDYADGWHVETPGGEILGTRILLHPHVDEQPFTRSLGGVVIPSDVTEVLVRSHNLISGYAPEVMRVPIGESGSGDTYEVERE